MKKPGRKSTKIHFTHFAFKLPPYMCVLSKQYEYIKKIVYCQRNLIFHFAAARLPSSIPSHEGKYKYKHKYVNIVCEWAT